ncbi:hypothetical protein [Paracoccus sp. PAR01]|jgi:hypothetical protein|uniref:hypothetical protein n=1 Tax=Paracoccus sp. PAR01 TaxID=2769282 RepID=UPI00177AA974|nr:hypothetical protein [Paracoccus sp. PAR01]MBD9529698.1 hypothetical protein [Paracoccus sp. PAR01]
MLEDKNGFALLHEPSVNDRRPSTASKGRCTGHIIVGPCPGRVLYFESRLEQNWALCLDAHPMTTVLREQVAFKWQNSSKKKPSTHFFDLFVEQTDGRRIAYTVKPEARLNAKFMGEIATVARQAKEAGFVDDVRLLTDVDLDPVELSNARLTYAMRVPDADADEAATAVIATMSDVASLGDLTTRIELGARGYRALIRMVRSGRLQPTRHEHLTHDTIVFAKGAAA